MTAHAFSISQGNVKTGTMPVTTTSAESCPTSCPFIDQGCYAKYGPLGMIWRALSATSPGDTFKNGSREVKSYDFAGLLAQIKRFAKGGLWRHNQAGDLPGIGDEIDPAALAAITAANRGKRGFTFTHKPLTPGNVAAIRAANAGGFTVNVSANSASEAARLKASYPEIPVVCVLPVSAENERVISIGDQKILVCPAARKGSEMTCAACGVCQIKERKSIVGFPAHGSGKYHTQRISGQAA